MVDPARKGFGSVVYGSLAAMIFGPGGLLLMVAGASGDRWAFGTLSVLAILTWVACAGTVMRRPKGIKRVFAMVWWGLALVTLATFNLRFHLWAADPMHLWPDDPYGFHLPPAWLNLPILSFYGSIGVGYCCRVVLPRSGNAMNWPITSKASVTPVNCEGLRPLRQISTPLLFARTS